MHMTQDLSNTVGCVHYLKKSIRICFGLFFLEIHVLPVMKRNYQTCFIGNMLSVVSGTNHGWLYTGKRELYAEIHSQIKFYVSLCEWFEYHFQPQKQVSTNDPA